MKKQYIFIILVFIVIKLFVSIFWTKYKDYSISTKIYELEAKNTIQKNIILEKNETLKYVNTISFKNKILKKEQNLKNPWEQVIFFTSPNVYKTFTNTWTDTSMILDSLREVDDKYRYMTNPQKWRKVLTELNM